ncbi:MAG: hypothetical protein K2Q01_09650, partial [Rickettsiales bacterium]|nr:hypothetical protein [Rickettsiales bacterium]
MNILIAVGTRPEAVKLAPVVLACRERGWGADVLFTGQHPTLAQPVFDIFGIIPKHHFRQNPYSFELADIAASYVQQAGVVIGRVKPDLVIVQG